MKKKPWYTTDKLADKGACNEHGDCQLLGDDTLKLEAIDNRTGKLVPGNRFVLLPNGLRLEVVYNDKDRGAVFKLGNEEEVTVVFDAQGHPQVYLQTKSKDNVLYLEVFLAIFGRNRARQMMMG